jgi:MFS family permease
MNTSASAAEIDSLFDRGRRGACVGALALVSLLAFEAIAVAAAMPAVAAALDGLELYAVAFGGMLAAAVLGMVWAGVSCDRHGSFRATATGLAVFTIGLLIAGFAAGMAWMVAGRIVQGLGAGMLGVALYAGMGQLVPSSLHPRLFALFATAWIVPALLGPVIAAWLVVQLGWRSVFLSVAAVVPLTAVALLPALALLPRPEPGLGEAKAPRSRIAWAALGAAGALLLHVAAKAGAMALPALALGLFTTGAAALRLLPRGTLSAAAGLPAVIALRGLLAAAFASAEVFVPLYLTRAAGWTLAQAGLALSAGAVLWSCGSAIQARIVAAENRRRALSTGFTMVAGGITCVVVQMLGDLPPWLVPIGWAVTGFGIGMSFPMLSVLTLSFSTTADRGNNASALQLSDALCSSATLAVAGALFNQANGGQTLVGFVLVFALSGVLAAGGAVLSGRAFA